MYAEIRIERDTNRSGYKRQRYKVVKIGNERKRQEAIEKDRKRQEEIEKDRKRLNDVETERQKDRKIFDGLQPCQK